MKQMKHLKHRHETLETQHRRRPWPTWWGTVVLVATSRWRRGGGGAVQAMPRQARWMGAWEGTPPRSRVKDWYRRDAGWCATGYGRGGRYGVERAEGTVDVEVEAGGMAKAAAVGVRHSGGGLNCDRGWVSGGNGSRDFLGTRVTES